MSVPAWTVSQIEHAVAAWREGQPASNIAIEVRKTRLAVIGKLRRLGEVGQFRGVWMTNYHDDVREMAAEGISRRDIARCWGISEATVNSILVGPTSSLRSTKRRRGCLVEAILNDWDNEWTAAEIAAKHSITLSHVTVTVHRARKRGDARAHSRPKHWYRTIDHGKAHALRREGYCLEAIAVELNTSINTIWKICRGITLPKLPPFSTRVSLNAPASYSEAIAS